MIINLKMKLDKNKKKIKNIDIYANKIYNSLYKERKGGFIWR